MIVQLFCLVAAGCLTCWCLWDRARDQTNSLLRNLLFGWGATVLVATALSVVLWGMQ